MCLATISPTSEIRIKRSTEACLIASKVNKSLAKLAAVASPTSRIPSEYKNLASVVCLAAFNASSKLVAFFGPIRSNSVNLPNVTLNRSAGVLIKSASTNCSTSLSPKPSTLSALRDAKCLIASLRCAPQYRPAVQRTVASPSIRSTSESHTGHVAGNTISWASSGRRSNITRATCGITSPARRMIT